MGNAIARDSSVAVGTTDNPVALDGRALSGLPTGIAARSRFSASSKRIRLSLVLLVRSPSPPGSPPDRETAKALPKRRT
jgi:hypothetical protein